MKVLLSWLRDFAPIEGDPVALGEQLSDLGLAVESLDRVGEGLAGGAVVRGVGRSTSPPVTWCRWPPSGPSCPTAWRSPGARCAASGRTACCAPPTSSG